MTGTKFHAMIVTYEMGGLSVQYILMNGNQPILQFICQQNAFGEIEAIPQKWLDTIHPIGFYDLTSYLERRKAPKHRKHIEELLNRYGCNDLEGFLRVTHALSLNDTFWVKEADSDLNWEDVSLYSNEFDELVSSAAFDGQFISTSMSTTSPEFGTDGYFAKCWVREEDSIYLYKSGSNTFEIEPLSEYLASQIAQQLCPEFVQYDMDFYHGKLISKCKLFTNESIGLVKAYDLLDRSDRNISGILRYFEHIGSGDAFRRMCVLDALILNTDRHLGNFGVLINNRTMEILQMSPVYDNNRSLLYDMDTDQLQRMEWCIQTCSPRIGKDFIATAKGMMTEEIRQDLIVLKDFRFKQHPYILVDQERLDQLDKIVQRQIDKILQ